MSEQIKGVIDLYVDNLNDFMLAASYKIWTEYTFSDRGYRWVDSWYAVGTSPNGTDILTWSPTPEMANTDGNDTLSASEKIIAGLTTDTTPHPFIKHKMNVEYNKIYYISIKAIDAAGQESYITQGFNILSISETTISCYVNSSNINIYINNVYDDIDGFYVEKTENLDPFILNVNDESNYDISIPFERVATVKKTGVATTYIDNNVLMSSKYFYRVIPFKHYINKINTFSYSNTLWARTNNIDFSSSQYLVKDVVSTIYSDTQVGLHWSMPDHLYSDFTSVTIDRLTKQTGVWSAPLRMGTRGKPSPDYVFDNSRNPHTSFYDEGLSPNTIYKYRITLYNSYVDAVLPQYYETEEITTPVSGNYLLPSVRNINGDPRLFINIDKIDDIRDNLGLLTGIGVNYDEEFADKFNSVVDGRLETYIVATPYNYRNIPNATVLNCRVLQLLSAYWIYKDVDAQKAEVYYNRANLELFNKRDQRIILNNTNNTFSCSSLLKEGEKIRISGTLPPELNNSTDYYIKKNGTEYAFSLTYGGAAIDFSTNGSNVNVKDYITGGLCLDVRSDDIEVPVTLAIAFDWMYHRLTISEKNIFGLALSRCLEQMCYQTFDDNKYSVQSEAYWFEHNREIGGGNINRNAAAIIACLSLSGESVSFAALQPDNTLYTETADSMISTVMGMSLTYLKKCCDVFDPTGGYYGGTTFTQSTLQSFTMSLSATKDNLDFDFIEILNHEDSKFGSAILEADKVGVGLAQAILLPMYMRVAWGEFPILDVTIDSITSEFRTNKPHGFTTNAVIAFYGDTSTITATANGQSISLQNTQFYVAKISDYRFRIYISSGFFVTLDGISNDLRVYDYYSKIDEFGGGRAQQYGNTSLQGDSMVFNTDKMYLPSHLMSLPFLNYFATRLNTELSTDIYNSVIWQENKLKWDLDSANTSNISMIAHNKTDDSPYANNMTNVKIFKGKESEIISMISDWSDEYPSQMIARAGGFSSDNAHIDRGNFVFHCGGVSWLSEFGHPTEFPDWENGWWRTNSNKVQSQNHNTIIIDDLNQNTNGYAVVTKIDGANKVAINLTDCYNHDMRELRREFELMGKDLIVTDHVYLNSPAKIISQFITTATVEISEDKKICKLSKRRWDDTLVFCYAFLQSPSNATWDVSSVNLSIPDNYNHTGEVFRVQAIVAPSNDSYIQVKYTLTETFNDNISTFVNAQDLVTTTSCSGESLYVQTITEIKKSVNVFKGKDIDEVQAKLGLGDQITINELTKLIKKATVEIANFNGVIKSVLTSGLPESTFANITDYGYGKEKSIIFNVTLTHLTIANTDTENTLYYSIDDKNIWFSLSRGNVVEMDTSTTILSVKSDNYKTTWFEFTIAYLGVPSGDLITTIPYVPAPSIAATGNYLVGAYYNPCWENYNEWSVLNSYTTKKSILGYYPVQSPEIADWHIRWALQHGIQYFVYNWYYDENGAVTKDDAIKALLKSKYKTSFKYCLLWNNIFDISALDVEQYLDDMFGCLNNSYFSNNYLKINNKYVLFISSPANIEKWLEYDTERIYNYLDSVKRTYDIYIIANVNKYEESNTLRRYETHGYDAISAYQLSAPAEQDDAYENYVGCLEDIYESIDIPTDTPFIPVCDIGFESSPVNDNLDLQSTGKTNILWKQALEIAKTYLDTPNRLLLGSKKIVLLQAWNEFGEGSFIEPNLTNGFDLLESVREVFAPTSSEPLLVIPSDLGKEAYLPKPYNYTFSDATYSGTNISKMIVFNVTAYETVISNIDPDGNYVEYSLDGNIWVRLPNTNDSATINTSITVLYVRSIKVSSYSVALYYNEPNYSNPVNMVYPPVPFTPDNDYIVSAYYYPGWTDSSKWDILNSSITYPAGFPERTSLLGRYAEGNVSVADWHFYWALSHGINCFIYDWYYDTDNVVEFGHAIEAMRRSKYGANMNFCIVWKNDWDMSGVGNVLTFMTTMVSELAETIFLCPNYLKIDNKLVVYIYDPTKIEVLCGNDDSVVENLLIGVKDYCRTNYDLEICFSANILQGESSASAMKYEDQGYDFISMYENSNPSPLSVDTYQNYLNGLSAKFDEFSGNLNIPFIPNIDAGWDNRAWYDRETVAQRTGKTSILFKQGLQISKNYLDTMGRNTPDGKKIVTIQAWNNFGEGNFIEPCEGFAFNYLEAIRQVFAPTSSNPNIKQPSDINWTLIEW